MRGPSAALIRSKTPWAFPIGMLRTRWAPPAGLLLPRHHCGSTPSSFPSARHWACSYRMSERCFRVCLRLRSRSRATASFLDIRSLEVLADLAIEPRDHLGGLCRSAEEVFYILDVVRGRFPFEALKRKVMEVKQRYGSATLLIEDSVPTTKPKRLAATANRLILAPDGRSLQVIWRALIGLFRSRAALEAENSRAGGLALSAQSAFHAA
jgi:hypothetical protein